MKSKWPTDELIAVDADMDMVGRRMVLVLSSLLIASHAIAMENVMEHII